MIEFRKLTTDDYPLLLEWLQRPHVKQYWNDGDDTLKKVIKHYALDNAEAKYLIAMQDGQDIGFYQYCYGENNNIGIDMFLANAQQLSQGLGTKCLLQFIKLVGQSEVCIAVTVDPHPNNPRGIKCYEKCGFKHIKTKSTDEIYFMRKPINHGKSKSAQSGR